MLLTQTDGVVWGLKRPPSKDMGQSILEQEDFIGLHHKLRQESLTHMFLCDETGVMAIPTPTMLPELWPWVQKQK